MLKQTKPPKVVTMWTGCTYEVKPTIIAYLTFWSLRQFIEHYYAKAWNVI